MKSKHLGASSAICALALLGTTSSAVLAQSVEVKDKPSLYTYFANWQIPRAHWGDMEKANAATRKIVDPAIGAGTLVGYGEDEVLVHQAEGPTHDGWWQSMSLAGVLGVLDSLRNGPPPPVFASATKHWDAIYVSRYYNWHAGTYKGAYTHAGYFRLKSDAPDDAIDSLSKNFMVPLMEKLLADGTVAEYEVDEEAVHTESPNGFWLIYVCPTAAGLDKVNAALGGAMKGNPLAGPALGSMVDISVHRDYLSRSNVQYK